MLNNHTYKICFWLLCVNVAHFNWYCLFGRVLWLFRPRTQMAPWISWIGNVQYQGKRGIYFIRTVFCSNSCFWFHICVYMYYLSVFCRLFGRVACTNWECYSKTITHVPHQNVSISSMREQLFCVSLDIVAAQIAHLYNTYKEFQHAIITVFKIYQYININQTELGLFWFKLIALKSDY